MFLEFIGNALGGVLVDEFEDVRLIKLPTELSL
jgi:hypothetical protein